MATTIRRWLQCSSSQLNTLPQELLDLINSVNENNFDLVFKDILKEKITCHMGFMLETFIESFPMSIIQMIAILQIYGLSNNFSNLIIVSSIFLSLLSIAFKSIMLLAVADLMTSIFNWSAAVIDFFNVFVIVAWLFLEIDSNENGFTSTQNLQYFVFALFTCTTIPFYFVFVSFLTIITYEPTRSWDRICFLTECCKKSCTLLAVLFLVGVGCIMGHIFCCVFIAFYVHKFGLYRFDDTKDGAYWAPIHRFIHRSNSRHDRVKRILCATIETDHKLKILTTDENLSNTCDDFAHRYEFQQFMDENLKNGFEDIRSFTELRKNIVRVSFFRQVTFSEGKLSPDQGGCMDDVLEWMLSYMAMPLYLFGRAVHLLFPVVVYVINLSVFGINGIFLLHHVLMISFCSLLLIVLVIGYKVVYFTYCIYHIGYWTHPPPLNKEMIQKVEDAYTDIVQLPVIIACFDERFGEDVSRLIVEYLKSISLT